MKPLIVNLMALTILVGCSPTGSISGDQPDAPPIKLPPEGKPGGATNDACEGVTERGECRGGLAVHCDVAGNGLRQVDCAALGQQCVIDPDRGAKCAALELGAPTEGPCGGLVSATGYCAEDGTAVWCDMDSAQIYAWNCGQSGLGCGVDECQSGAYCCEQTSQPDPQAPDECATLGFDGECSGEMARWCTGSNTLIEIDCAAEGKVCGYDQCAVGAYCCTPPEPVNPCAELGSYGECGGADGNTLRYCLGDTLYENTCGTGQSCMLDVCFSGAECCTQAEYDAACQSMGFDGKCGGADGNTAVWCPNGEIQREDCTATGKTCQIDVCEQGAWCC